MTPILNLTMSSYPSPAFALSSPVTYKGVELISIAKNDEIWLDYLINFIN